MVWDISVAADKYDVSDLQSIRSKMLSTVDLNSVIDTFLLADFYRDESLKKSS